MTELQVLDIIDREFRAMGQPSPVQHDRRVRITYAIWQRVARRIVAECHSDCQRAARAASMAGAMITRGRTRL